jgi:hypothetical protein
MFAVWERFWARTPESGNEAKSHKINGPCIFVCSHNPKVVSSNLTAATKVSSPSIISANPATVRIDNFGLKHWESKIPTAPPAAGRPAEKPRPTLRIVRHGHVSGFRTRARLSVFERRRKNPS